MMKLMTMISTYWSLPGMGELCISEKIACPWLKVNQPGRRYSKTKMLYFLNKGFLCSDSCNDSS